MKCSLCPRQCGVDRSVQTGFCQMSDKIKVARAGLHLWEEPCISGTRGSGTVFFSGCVMRCVYCQNFQISAQGKGREITAARLAEIFIQLKEQGAHNINLVNPTHFVPQIIEALDMARTELDIPIVYNSGGYERVETLKLLRGYIDIYLPDVKYYSDEAARLSSAPHYFDVAMAAVEEMVSQTGRPQFDGELLKKGTVVRHMVLPYLYKDSIEVIKRAGERFGKDILFSLMSQYTPFYKAKDDPRLNRRITTFEYNKALEAVMASGLEGFMQQRSSAKEEYTPEFDLSGI